MGSGVWTTSSLNDYITSTRNMTAADYTTSNLLDSQIYVAESLHERLNPYGITRECVDSEEHPQSLPIILGLDVTGSMGPAAAKTAKALGEIMSTIYEDKNVVDPEFCIMSIGDLNYDRAPVQMSQFESDIRIQEQLDLLYMERGGGGNCSESYSAAWYMALHHVKADAISKGRRGIIITLGDERLNPDLPAFALKNHVGDNVQRDVETADLYKEVIEAGWVVYHISITDGSSFDWQNRDGRVDASFKKVIGENHYFQSDINTLPAVISQIISQSSASINSFASMTDETGAIAW